MSDHFWKSPPFPLGKHIIFTDQPFRKGRKNFSSHKRCRVSCAAAARSLIPNLLLAHKCFCGEEYPGEFSCTRAITFPFETNFTFCARETHWPCDSFCAKTCREHCCREQQSFSARRSLPDKRTGKNTAGLSTSQRCFRRVWT